MIDLSRPFMQLLLADKVLPGMIYDYVEYWHCNEDLTESLSDFLGLSSEEWEKFVTQQRTIHQIVQDRQGLMSYEPLLEMISRAKRVTKSR